MLIGIHHKTGTRVHKILLKLKIQVYTLSKILMLEIYL